MKNISAAFVKAQIGFSPALKTATNPFFKSKYADLSACVEAVIDSLNDNGIALVQNCHESETGVIVETVFIHESGETISCGKLHVPAAKNDPQGYGSALTYARRYSLMAACGIAPEDDDANSATKAKKEEHRFKAGEKDEIIKQVRECLFNGDEVGLRQIFGEYTSPEEKTKVWSLFTSTERSSIKSMLNDEK
jgi:hypothetical protein